jgi:plastocyanin
VIDTFDSRNLRRTDCYGQRFMRTGEYRYHVLPAGGHAISSDRPYVINVVERKDDSGMKQHDVSLHHDGQRFVPDLPSLGVEEGDLVVWNCPNAGAVGYVVAGDRDFFGSSILVNECGFSHAFSAAGEYDWVDAHGSDIGGVVRVTDPACATSSDVERWRASLSEGTLVMITDGTVEPREVEILTGQTVYFAVVAGPGVTVTDRRLVGKASAVPSEC